MKVRRIVVRAAPGLPEGVRAEKLDPGLTVIAGPNASGKSTLARTLRGALWRETAPPEVAGEVEVETAAGTAVATLRWGTVTWEPGPPPLPGPEALALTRLDLPALLAAGEAEDRIAHRIAVELAGGYDLDAALEATRVPHPRRGELQTGLETARRELRAAEGELRRLAEEEARLPGLEAELERTRAAQALAGPAERAVEFARVREALSTVEARLRELPTGLDRLTGDEAERLREMKERLREAEEEIARFEARRHRLEERLAGLRFPGDPPAGEALAAWAGRARELEQRAHKAETLRRELAEAAAEVERNARGLFREPDEGLAPDPGAIDALGRALEQLDLSRAALAAQEVELEIWRQFATAADPAAIPRLERAARRLRAWLAGRRPAVPHAVGWAALAAGSVLAAVAVALVWPAPVLAAGTGLLGAGLGWLLASRRAGRGGRSSVHGLPADLAPSAWTEEAVQEALDRVERELARARLAEEAGKRAREAEERVEDERHRVEHTFAVSVVAAAQALGLDPELPFAVLSDQARRIERWHRAEEQRVRTGAALEALEQELAADLDALNRWLTGFGCEAVEEPAGAAAAVEAIRLRLTELEAVQRHTEELEENLAAARDRARSERAGLAELWERTGVTPGDEPALARRLEQLSAWKALSQERRSLTDRIAALEAGLEGHWEALGLDPARLDPEAASTRLERLRSEADRVETLVEAISTARAAIDSATAGDRLESARTRVAEAALAVAARRDEAMEGALVRLVLERAREAVARDHAPAVLDRARQWFRRFTNGAFRLEVDAAGTLSAVDTRDGSRRRLEQLSDGTRIHLLLAARLAALEHAEAGAGPVPLVLDEALSTTDPVRFRGIARALAEATRAGRQILYLTADPAEVHHWRQAFEEAGIPGPAVVALAPASETGTWTVPEPAEPPPPPEPGEDAAAYARRLGIPPPDPRAGLDAWPVLWLLPDRLEAVHRLLEAGVERVGAWCELARAGTPLLDAADAALLEGRAALARAALDAWRIGRGRPVSWDAVASSGAVSSAYADRVRQLLDTHGDDARAFVAAVRRLKGFRSAKADDLESHLIQEGILDPRDPLSRDQILARALAAAEAVLARTATDPAAAARWLSNLLATLD